jgi:hypothetical protein
VRVALVRALCSCVGDGKRGRARRFLQGLSADELQYIAEFLGSCILETEQQLGSTWGQLAEDVVRFERCRRAAAPRKKARPQDEDHKMILLFEYLSCCNSRRTLASAAET